MHDGGSVAHLLLLYGLLSFKQPSSRTMVYPSSMMVLMTYVSRC